MTNLSYAAEKMEFVKEEREDMSDEETHRMKDEDTEEQRGCSSFLTLCL